MTIKTLFFAACMVLTSAAYAATSAPVALGTFGDWEATSFKDNKGRVCFMASVPKKERGAEGKKRGEVRLFITHWAGEGSKNVVSVAAGYPYRKNSDVKIKVDGQTFRLFTEEEMAWTNDQATDNALADAIRKGSRLTVTGTSSRGTTTVDTYSLKGSADAYDAITKACKV